MHWSYLFCVPMTRPATRMYVTKAITVEKEKNGPGSFEGHNVPDVTISLIIQVPFLTECEKSEILFSF